MKLLMVLTTKVEDVIMMVSNIEATISFKISHLYTKYYVLSIDDWKTFLNFVGTLQDWWANSTSEEYLKRAKCMIYKYGNFTSKQVGMPINGINSQGENIADNGGIKEAYGAYRK